MPQKSYNGLQFTIGNPTVMRNPRQVKAPNIQEALSLYVELCNLEYGDAATVYDLDGVEGSRFCYLDQPPPQE